ncbi:MAG: ABC-type Fe3+-siderophore transport system, permease component, partial [uncultured Rubrobacteraceae bacterium]
EPALAVRVALRADGWGLCARSFRAGERAVRGGSDRDVGGGFCVCGLRRGGGGSDHPHLARAEGGDRGPRRGFSGGGRRDHPGADAQSSGRSGDTRDRGRGGFRGGGFRVPVRGLVVERLRALRVPRSGPDRGARLLSGFPREGRDDAHEAHAGGGGARRYLSGRGRFDLLAHDGDADPQPAHPRRDPVLARGLGRREGSDPAPSGPAVHLRGAAPGVRPEPADHGPEPRRGRRPGARPEDRVGQGGLRRRRRAAGRERGRRGGADRIRRARGAARRALLRGGGLPLDPAVLGAARGRAARLGGRRRPAGPQAPGATPRRRDGARRRAVLYLSRPPEREAM